VIKKTRIRPFWGGLKSFRWEFPVGDRWFPVGVSRGKRVVSGGKLVVSDAGVPESVGLSGCRFRCREFGCGVVVLHWEP
jgi:hypothetical protein